MSAPIRDPALDYIDAVQDAVLLVARDIDNRLLLPRDTHEAAVRLREIVRFGHHYSVKTAEQEAK